MAHTPESGGTMMDTQSALLQLEQSEGCRLSWNAWPSSRIEASRTIVPFGVMISPLRAVEGSPTLPYEPLPCKGCASILNCYCQVDYASKMWVCPFCHTRNGFPAHYAGISESNLPAELFPQYVSLTYTLRTAPAPPPAFVFTVDLCQPREDLAACVDSIKQTIGSLPERSLVGLVTFGERVHLYELGYGNCSKLWVLRGDASIPKDKLASMLLLSNQTAPQQKQNHQMNDGSGGCEGRFLVPLSECEFALEAALDELQPDAQDVAVGFRPRRCTGAAMDVAVSLFEAAGGVSSGRVMMFLSGPITHGPGLMVDIDMAVPLRCHKDFDKGTGVAKHFKKSHAFFTGVASRAVASGVAADLFACAMDQVGVAEMAPTAERTGGVIVLADGFDHPVYRNTIKSMFERDPATGQCKMGFQATSDVFCTREVRVSGCIGAVTAAATGASSSGAASGRVSETDVGCGGTTSWRLGCVDERSSYAYYFDIVQSHNNAIRPGDPFYLQFQTRYVAAATGETRVKVTTLARRWCDPARLDELVAGFDQEAAGVLMARISVWRGETEDAFDVLRWLDRTLIRLCSKYGEYQKDDPNTFRLSPYMSLYPQFIFHLRRSPFLQVFNSSPDETAYFRSVLNREGVSTAAVMIQPTLLRYALNPNGGAPVGMPAVLDVSSLAPDVILLLDTFFHVVVFHGQTVAQWRDAGYHEKPEHAAFKALLEVPQNDASALINSRMPTPRFVDCDQNGSQARFVLARLNPSATHNTAANNAGEVIFTDDVSFSVFVEHLARTAVAGNV